MVAEEVAIHRIADGFDQGPGRPAVFQAARVVDTSDANDQNITRQERHQPVRTPASPRASHDRARLRTTAADSARHLQTACHARKSSTPNKPNITTTTTTMSGKIDSSVSTSSDLVEPSLDGVASMIAALSNRFDALESELGRLRRGSAKQKTGLNRLLRRAKEGAASRRDPASGGPRADQTSMTRATHARHTHAAYPRAAHLHQAPMQSSSLPEQPQPRPPLLLPPGLFVAQSPPCAAECARVHLAPPTRSAGPAPAPSVASHAGSHPPSSPPSAPVAPPPPQSAAAPLGPHRPAPAAKPPSPPQPAVPSPPAAPPGLTRTHVSATPGPTRMRCVQPDGTGTDLGMIDLSQDMSVVLQSLYAAGASPDVDMVRMLRQHFHVRFDVHTHRARLKVFRSRLTSWGRTTQEGLPSIRVGALPPSGPVSGYFIDEVIATERASLKRVRARAGPTGRPNIGSKVARAAARIAMRAA